MHFHEGVWIHLRSTAVSKVRYLFVSEHWCIPLPSYLPLSACDALTSQQIWAALCNRRFKSIKWLPAIMKFHVYEMVLISQRSPFEQFHFGNCRFRVLPTSGRKMTMITRHLHHNSIFTRLQTIIWCHVTKGTPPQHSTRSQFNLWGNRPETFNVLPSSLFLPTCWHLLCLWPAVLSLNIAKPTKRLRKICCCGLTKGLLSFCSCCTVQTSDLSFQAVLRFAALAKLRNVQAFYSHQVCVRFRCFVVCNEIWLRFLKEI